MIAVGILGTASLLPGRAVSTAEVAASVTPPQSRTEVERKTGILSRNWVAPATEVAPIAAQVLKAALDNAGLRAADLRRIIFVSSGGGDYVVPATANRVAALLGLAGSCDAFDINNACMGFLTAFDIAGRSVATGLSPIGVVVVELLSQAIRPEDPRPYVVGGDGAAAVVLGGARPNEGIIEMVLRNDGTRPDDVVLRRRMHDGPPEYLQFVQSSGDIAKTALDALVEGATSVLAAAGLKLADVDWVLPHQPNGRLLRIITEAMGIAPSRTISIVHETGAIAAAAIPMSLDRLRRTMSVKPGDRILMVGVGAGVSHGALLYRVGGP